MSLKYETIPLPGQHRVIFHNSGKMPDTLIKQSHFTCPRCGEALPRTVTQDSEITCFCGRELKEPKQGYNYNYFDWRDEYIQVD